MSLSPDIFLKSPLLDRGLLCYNKNRQNAAGFFTKLFLRRYISQQQLLSTHIPIPVSSIYNIYIYHIFSGLESPRFYKRFSFHESSVFPFFYYFLFYHLYHVLRSITRIFPKIIIFIRLSRNKWILWTAGSKEQALTKRRQICLYVTAGGGADET